MTVGPQSRRPVEWEVLGLNCKTVIASRQMRGFLVLLRGMWDGMHQCIHESGSGNQLER